MKPKPSLLRTLSRILLTAVLGQGIAALLSVLFLKRLDRAVLLIGRAAAPGEPFVETLARVFSALGKAEVVPGIFPACLLFLAASVLLHVWPDRTASSGKRVARAFCVLAAVLLILAAFLLTLWRTEVNGIRFGDVLSSLIRTVRSGALDSL